MAVILLNKMFFLGSLTGSASYPSKVRWLGRRREQLRVVDRGTVIGVQHKASVFHVPPSPNHHLSPAAQLRKILNGKMKMTEAARKVT